ncbi:cysteine hydrolase family protein [Aquimarina aquimarini]|uniref:cysteine hydrolase family protein n=1 Tax=Aquimarina aquimarini TaxID=1191734 RepID=UPI000D54FE4F|nr:cysteine hydrolase family protein [Aquimarina aquimarini]
MNLKKQNVALILIDIQKGFDDEQYWGGNRNNKDAEVKSALILNKWRELDLPIFHIIHSSDNPISRLHESHPGFEIKDEVKPINGEPILVKNVNSAFIGTDLKERLDNQAIKKVVIIGLTTNHCVSTTARMAGNYGFDTLLVSDATATFDRIGINGEKFSSEIIHQTSLANLNDEFAQVVDTKKLLELV